LCFFSFFKYLNRTANGIIWDQFSRHFICNVDEFDETTCRGTKATDANSHFEICASLFYNH